MLKKCCNLGTNYAKSGLKCSNFQTPIAGVSQADEPFCLNSIDVCCKKEHREQECQLGQEEAQLGKPCSTDEFKKECCEACEIGIEAGVSGQSCKTVLGLGPSMDLAFTACCEKSLSNLSTTKSTSSTKTASTISAPSTTPSPKSSQKPIADNTSLPNLEVLCDAPDLCPHICIQTGQSYRCECYTGYTLMSDGISCKPNKRSGSVSQRCLENNPCDHNCIDTGVAIKCSCYDGYKLDTDKKTCKDIDECALNIHDCEDNEICVNLEGDYDCQETETPPQKVGFNDKCPEGYKFNGQQMVCDDINECEMPIICPKPSVCINTIGSYRCENTPELPKCPPGFYFKPSILTCDDIDECITGNNDCNKESQICLNTRGNYTCIDKASKKTCPPGFKKNIFTQQCEDINECEENIQLCNEDEECVNELGGHSCRSKVVLQSSPSPPSSSTKPSTLPSPSPTPTVQTTTHRPTPTSTQRTNAKPLYISTPEAPTTSKPVFPLFVPPVQRVTCSNGYKYSPQLNACIDIDECKEISQICDSNQDCYNTVGSYVCSCKIGFSKDHQTGACVDINECQIGKHDCGEAQRCDNTIGSYVCARTTGCGTGYTLNSATGLCEDDDECLLGLHNCHDLGPKFQCRNTLGSYRCERIRCLGDCQPKVVPSTTNLVPTPYNPIISGQLKKCLPGYRMNQRGECEDIDECESNPCKRGEKCLNLNGKYQCIPLMYCKSGYELNEAGTGCEDINECTKGTHKCKNSQICKNGPGYYICQCPPGHKLNPDNECEDINECDFYRDRICSRNSQCINTVGSYECKCKEGFRANGHACDDIDECSEVSGLCHQNCVNLWGGYRCSCNRGFTLSVDNRTCTDINECEKFRDKQLCVGTCQNTPGSYTCRCPEGYRLGSDGRTCQDIDECHGNICRNPDDICINTRGSYKCHTIMCPPNYIKDPEHKSRCKRASNVCDIRDTQCIRMPGQYSYHFITFVSNLPIHDEGKIDFFQMKGPSWTSSTANFNMDIVNVRCPPHIKQADSGHFRMKRDLHKVIVSLVRSIEGPQEIELQLQMELYVSGAFQGKVVSTIFIYVSEYEF